MKIKVKNDGSIKMKLSQTEFQSLYNLMCHVRLGDGKDPHLTEIAREVIDSAYDLDVFEDGEDLDFEVSIQSGVPSLIIN